MSTNKKKASAPAKVAAVKKPVVKTAAKSKKPVSKNPIKSIEFGVLGKDADKFMQHPLVRIAFGKMERDIIRGHEKISSPNYVKTIQEAKSKLKVTVMAIPESNEIAKDGGTVYATTIIDKICYEEITHFTSLDHACEYVTDFSQVQAARFTNRAVKDYAQSIINKAANQIEPMLKKANEQINEANDKKAALTDNREQPAEAKK